MADSARPDAYLGEAPAEMATASASSALRACCAGVWMMSRSCQGTCQDPSSMVASQFLVVMVTRSGVSARVAGKQARSWSDPDAPIGKQKCFGDPWSCQVFLHTWLSIATITSSELFFTFVKLRNKGPTTLREPGGSMLYKKGLFKVILSPY